MADWSAAIAAAPDLLAALQDIMNARWVPAGMREDHCDAARAAIYKATMEAMEPMREDAARLARLETAAREYIEAWDDSDHVSDEALHAKRNALRAALESPA